MSVQKAQIQFLQDHFKEYLECAKSVGYHTGPYPKGSVPLDAVYNNLPKHLMKGLHNVFKLNAPVVSMPPPPHAQNLYPDFEEGAKKRGSLQPDSLFSKQIILHDIGSGDFRRTLRGSTVGTAHDRAYVGSKIVFHTPDETDESKISRQRDVKDSFCAGNCWINDDCPKRSPAHFSNATVTMGYIDLITESPSWKNNVSFFLSFNVITNFDPMLQAKLFRQPGIHMAPNWERMLNETCALPVDDPDKCIVVYGGKAHEEYKVITSCDLIVNKNQVYSFYMNFPRGNDIDLSTPTEVNYSYDYFQERPEIRRPTPLDFKGKTGSVWKLKRDGYYESVVITAPNEGKRQYLIMGPYGTRSQAKFLRFDIPLENKLMPLSAYFERYEKDDRTHHEFLGLAKVFMTPIRCPLRDQYTAYHRVFPRFRFKDDNHVFYYPQLMTGNGALKLIIEHCKADDSSDGIVDVSECEHSAFKDVQSVDLRDTDVSATLIDVSRSLGVPVRTRGVDLRDLTSTLVREYQITVTYEKMSNGELGDVIYLDHLRDRPDKFTSNNRKRVTQTINYSVNYPSSLDELLKME